MTLQREVRGWVSASFPFAWIPSWPWTDAIVEAKRRDGKVPVVLIHADDHAALVAEVERLRAGGCARDQRLTQHCAEAEALRAELEQWRANAAALMEEVEDYEHTPDTPTDAHGHTEEAVKQKPFALGGGEMCRQCGWWRTITPEDDDA